MQVGAIPQALGLDGDERAACIEGALTRVQQGEHLRQPFFILALREGFRALGLRR